MDMLRSNQGPKLNRYGHGKLVGSVANETGVRWVIIKRHMVDTTAPANCVCCCCESCAHVDHGKPAAPPDTILLATEHLSDTLNRSVKVRRVKVLDPVDGKVLFVLSHLKRRRRRNTITAHGGWFAVPREVILVRQRHVAYLDLLRMG